MRPAQPGLMEVDVEGLIEPPRYGWAEPGTGLHSEGPGVMGGDRETRRQVRCSTASWPCPSCGLHVRIGEAAKTNNGSAVAGVLALEATRNKPLSHPKRSYCLGFSPRRRGRRQEMVNRAAPTSHLGSSHH